MENIKKPNVILIYPDQMRYDAMSNSGNNIIKTPGIDRLAYEGVNFKKAYTSFPLCCPFRASIFTGKYAHSHGLYANHYPIPLNQEFLPEIMKRNGYKTGWIGKWHLNGGNKYEYVPEDYRLGFESFVGYSRGHEYNNSVFYRENDTTPRKSKLYDSEYQTNHLFEFIEGALKEDKPFFAGICYGMPHPPLIGRENYINLYKPEEIELSEIVPEEEAQKAKEFIAKYYGLVTCVDNQITRILNWLDYIGIADDTVIIFVSDHGDLAGDFGLYNKKSYYDGSMHVPFIIRCPKRFRNGANIDQLVDPSVDIFPTILDICGIEIPNYVQGLSLKNLLINEESSLERDYVYYQIIKQPFKEIYGYGPAERGIRTDRFLYISKSNKPYKLFDLSKDPKETTNLINDENYSNVVKELNQFLSNKMTEIGDNWNICYDSSINNYQTYEEGIQYTKNLYEKALYDIQYK